MENNPINIDNTIATNINTSHYSLHYKDVSAELPEIRQYIQEIIQLDTDITLTDNQHYKFIANGFTICEKLLEIYTTKNSICTNNFLIKQPFGTFISYVEHIWPEEIIKFLEVINKYRNETVHSNFCSHVTTNIFSKAFELFVKFYFSQIIFLVNSTEEKIKITSILDLIDYSLSKSISVSVPVATASYNNIKIEPDKSKLDGTDTNNKASLSQDADFSCVASMKSGFSLLGMEFFSAAATACGYNAVQPETDNTNMESPTGVSSASHPVTNQLLSSKAFDTTLTSNTLPEDDYLSGITNDINLINSNTDIPIFMDDATLQLNKRQLNDRLSIILERKKEIYSNQEKLKLQIFNVTRKKDLYNKRKFGAFNIHSRVCKFSHELNNTPQIELKQLEQSQFELEEYFDELTEQEYIVQEKLYQIEKAEQFKIKDEDNFDTFSATKKACDISSGLMATTDKEISTYSNKEFFSGEKSAYTDESQESKENSKNKSNNDNLMLMMQELLKTIEELRKENAEAHNQQAQKLDHITNAINELSDRIECYQSLVKAQINRIEEENLREPILAAFIDECATKIRSQIFSQVGQNKKETIKDQLIGLLGKVAWERLTRESQEFLISAYLIYDHLNSIKSKLDYSCVCVLLSKVVERELIKRLFIDFQRYIKSNYSYRTALEKYPKILLYKNKPKQAQYFSLGNVPILLCTKDPYPNDQDYDHDKEILVEYATNVLFKNKSVAELEDLFATISDQSEDIRRNYRNPSAHTESIDSDIAEDCMNYIVETEKVLKFMMEAFSY